MSSIRRLACLCMLALILMAGCGVDLQSAVFSPQPPGFANAPGFATPPLPIGATSVLVAQPAPMVSEAFPLFVPDIGVVIYIDP